MFQTSLQEWNFQESDLISFCKMWHKLYHKKCLTDTREKDKTSWEFGLLGRFRSKQTNKNE